VLMATGNGCEAARSTAKSLGELKHKYQSQGVEFLAIDSNLKDTTETIAAETARTHNEIPVLFDELQLIGESLDLTRNGEVLILNPQNWQVIYRGAAAAGATNYVVDALDAVLSARPVKVAQTSAPGCAILMPERDR